MPTAPLPGVVVATVDADYFAQFYKQFDVGPNGAILLLGTSGIGVWRAASAIGAAVGRDLSSSPLIKNLRGAADCQHLLFHIADRRRPVPGL